ncbi:hypothetical protein PENSPDRAFT_688815 [Peniophora sp. CONT]|nr:hypothetical protein PENSPDRAFT_688815 [Peniophora sp. CONT]
MATVTARRAASNTPPERHTAMTPPRTSPRKANTSVPTVPIRDLVFARYEEFNSRLAIAEAAKEEAEARLAEQEEAYRVRLLEEIEGEPEANSEINTVDGESVVALHFTPNTELTTSDAIAAFKQVIARLRAEAASSAKDAKKARCDVKKQKEKVTDLKKENADDGFDVSCECQQVAASKTETDSLSCCK